MALTVVASPANAEARRPGAHQMRATRPLAAAEARRPSEHPMRATLPLATADVLRNLHSRRQEMALRLAMVQAAVRARRAYLVARYQRRAARAVRFAYAQRGVPYVWGGTGRRGYDCSGLTQRSWRKAGVHIPRVAAAQFRGIRHHVRRRDLRPGDLLYFDGLGHTGLYIGHGRFIHAPHTGTVVQVARLRGYYLRNFVGAVRPSWPRLPRIPTRLT